MLRISTLNGPHAVTLKLAGKVIHDWIPEARRSWLEVSDRRKLIVDLTDVSFVDELGRRLLCEMHAAGAKLVGSGPMLSALIEEIQGERPAVSRGLSPRLLLFLIGLLVTLSLYKFNS